MRRRGLKREEYDNGRDEIEDAGPGGGGMARRATSNSIVRMHFGGGRTRMATRRRSWGETRDRLKA
eukprot:1658170-Pyramimonas_sp.AAC.1